MVRIVHFISTSVLRPFPLHTTSCMLQQGHPCIACHVMCFVFYSIVIPIFRTPDTAAILIISSIIVKEHSSRRIKYAYINVPPADIERTRKAFQSRINTIPSFLIKTYMIIFWLQLMKWRKEETEQGAPACPMRMFIWSWWQIDINGFYVLVQSISL